MKQITLMTLAVLALMVTVAAAQQGNWSGNHMRGSANVNGSCPMNGNMNGAGMMNQHRMVKGAGNNLPMISQNNNWKVNPSYQGQVTAPTTVEK